MGLILFYGLALLLASSFYWRNIVVNETSLSFNTIKNTLQFRATDF